MSSNNSQLALRKFEDGQILSANCKSVVADAITTILTTIGEDPQREGLKRTPERVARMYDEILAGYAIDPQTLLNDALFEVEYDEMVLINNIEFYSMCEHHLLPIVGTAHVAYVPGRKVVGLSKIPRIVDAFARRLQVQERMTRQIADLLDELVHPKGVAVVVDASHMCVMMRGAKKSQARMRTSALTGVFKENPKTRSEFLAHIPPAPSGYHHPD